MQNKGFLLLFVVIHFLACSKSPKPLPDPLPPPGAPAIVTNEYDATYTSNSGTFYTYSYHVKDTLYYSETLKQYEWSSTVSDVTGVRYRTVGKADSLKGLTKGCYALVSSINPSQQPNYNYFIGSYYQFSFFNDSAIGNIQFMVPADGLLKIDSPTVSANFYTYHGGLQSYYRLMPKAEAKVTANLHFVQWGDSFSYGNPLIPATGAIDSMDVSLLVRRFSDNNIRPNSKINRTVDGHYVLKYYFHDGSYLNIINAEFKNLFFQVSTL